MTVLYSASNVTSQNFKKRFNDDSLRILLYIYRISQHKLFYCEIIKTSIAAASFICELKQNFSVSNSAAYSIPNL